MSETTDTRINYPERSEGWKANFRSAMEGLVSGNRPRDLRDLKDDPSQNQMFTVAMRLADLMTLVTDPKPPKPRRGRPPKTEGA